MLQEMSFCPGDRIRISPFGTIASQNGGPVDLVYLMTVDCDKLPVVVRSEPTDRSVRESKCIPLETIFGMNSQEIVAMNFDSWSLLMLRTLLLYGSPTNFYMSAQMGSEIGLHIFDSSFGIMCPYAQAKYYGYPKLLGILPGAAGWNELDVGDPKFS